MIIQLTPLVLIFQHQIHAQVGTANDHDLRLHGLDFDSLPVNNTQNTTVDIQPGCDFLHPQYVRTIKINYPCVVCNKRCTNAHNTICCNVCDEWTHKKCARLSDEEFEVYSSTDKPFYCVKCLYEKNDPNALNSVLTNSSYNMLSSLPTNSICPSENDSAPSSPFWLNDDNASVSRYYDVDETNILLKASKNNDFFVMHVNAVSLETRHGSIKARCLLDLKKPQTYFLLLKQD